MTRQCIKASVNRRRKENVRRTHRSLRVYLEKEDIGRCQDSDIELGIDIIHCILSLESPVLLPPFCMVQSAKSIKAMEEINKEIEACLAGATAPVYECLGWKPNLRWRRARK